MNGKEKRRPVRLSLVILMLTLSTVALHRAPTRPRARSVFPIIDLISTGHQGQSREVTNLLSPRSTLSPFLPNRVVSRLYVGSRLLTLPATHSPDPPLPRAFYLDYGYIRTAETRETK